MMTKKHFSAIAAALKMEMDRDDVSHYTVRRIANSLADICKSSNPDFDRDRFMKAAGFDRIEFASAGATRRIA